MYVPIGNFISSKLILEHLKGKHERLKISVLITNMAAPAIKKKQKTKPHAWLIVAELIFNIYLPTCNTTE